MPIKFLGIVVAALVVACAGIPKSELAAIGSKVHTADIDFEELYAYAERSKAAYATGTVIRSRYPATIRVYAPDKSHVQYFAERDDDARTQYITVRGTANDWNVSEDLKIRIREDRRIDIPVHAGFDAAAQAVYSDVKSLLKPGYKTYLTGHSLGGAVAAVVAIYLIEDGVAVERVVTFGQPRFTTAAGVARLSDVPLLRLVDENDIVPLVPPSTKTVEGSGTYEHVGAEIILLEGPDYVLLPAHDANRIDLGEFWRDISLADLDDHHIDKYLRRLESKKNRSVAVAYSNRERYVVRKAAIAQ